MGSDGKLPTSAAAAVKGPKGWAQRFLNVGFVAGFLLVLLTYAVFSQQSQRFGAVVASPDDVAAISKQAIKAPGEPGLAQEDGGEEKAETTRPAEPSADHHQHQDTSGDSNQDNHQQPEQEWRPKAVVTEEPPKRDDTAAKPFDNGKVVCTTAGPYSETCDVFGDVRTNGMAHTVTLVPATSFTERREWTIKPYIRRTMSGIPEVTITQLDSTSASSPAPACTVTHHVPAIVFALGGLTGNYWHDFSDALVPLFVASRRYGGEVQLLVSNIQPWWLGKYEAIVRRLSKYDAVDLDRDEKIRCFPRVTVGLRMHKEFDIVPEFSPDGQRLAMTDFTAFLRETYSLPRAAPISLKQTPEKKPRLMLLHRGHYRKIVNVPEIVKAAEKAGFEVAISDPRFGVQVEELARSVNSFDVLMGVHGAGLTNAVFLPKGAVVIQVVPYGKMEPLAKLDFGDPIVDMELRYLEYSITAQESTLLEMLGPDHPVIKDPESVHRSGWDKVAEYYLGKQDVKLDLERFAPTLELALDHLRQQ
ncbi:hypothetical protein ACQ4PT_037193 [Festuca glaucescens]